MSKVAALRRAMRAAGGWEDREVSIPRPALQKIAVGRLHQAGFRLRSRSPFGTRRLEVTDESWWFGQFLGAEVEIKSQKEASRIGWRALGSNAIRGNERSADLLRVAPGLCALMLAPSLDVEPIVALLYVLGCLPLFSRRLAFFVTGGGFRGIRARRARFMARVAATVEEAVSAAQKVERAAGQLSISTDERAGDLALADGAAAVPPRPV